MRRIIWMIIQGRYLVSNECNIWIKIFFVLTDCYRTTVNILTYVSLLTSVIWRLWEDALLYQLYNCIKHQVRLDFYSPNFLDRP